jgi:putative membrane protein
MKGFWMAAAAVLIALPGCADLSQETAPSPIGSSTPTELPAPGAPSSAGDYAWEAALVDMYETRSSELALTRATSPAVRDFAQQMVSDHAASASTRRDALAAVNVHATPPATLDQRRQSLLAALNSASDRDFDRLYLRQQMTSQQRALTLHLSYADGGDEMPVRDQAAAAADQVLGHIAMLRQIPLG